YASARGFYSDQTAACRGDADRTSTVAALGDRVEPSRDGCGRSSARSAGGMFAIPGIAGGGMQSALSRRTHPEFGRGGFSEQDTARVAQPHREFGIGRRIPFFEIFGTECRREIPGPGQVLE